MTRFAKPIHPLGCGLAAACLLSATVGGGLPVQVTRGPYLQMGTSTSVSLHWRTDAATSSRVLYGDAPGNLTSSVELAGARTEHVLQLATLDPGTRYYYAVGDADNLFLGGDDLHFFETAPPTGMPEPLRIWVLGDSGTGNTNAMAVRDAYYAYNGTGHTNLWLMLGDNAYPDGADIEYQAKVFDFYPEILRTSVLWPTFGNHDGFTADSPTESGPYYDIFELPLAGQAGGVPSGTEAYYAFDWGNVHFVVLNSEDINRQPLAPMMAWLDQDLAATLQDWTIAYWHHPPYTKGSHDSDEETRHIDMREFALPILEGHGVDLVLGGHSHSYERSYMIDGHYQDSSTFDDSFKMDLGDGEEGSDGAYLKADLGPAAHQGAVYVVAGSSGQISSGPLDHPAMLRNFLDFGSVILDVEGNRLDAVFLNSGGEELDRFTMIKGDDSLPPIAEFTVDKQTGTMPLDVRFNDLTDGVATDWSWDFDDDGVPDSALRNPSHRYTQPGTYGVRLTASNASGFDDELKTALICVTAGMPGPVVGLEFDADRQTFSWQPASPGSRYDAVKGSLELLQTGDGDFAGSQLGCLMHETASIEATDVEAPGSGQAFYYTVRALDCAAETGTHDSGGVAQTTSRDVPLQGASAVCACDPADDVDGDGYCTRFDNCPGTGSQSLADDDLDGLGNPCDTCPLDATNDIDGDGTCEDEDNCPGLTNKDQNDLDRDGQGDLCDPCPIDAVDDADGDGVCADTDNCPVMANSDQQDVDADDFGDICDPCPGDDLNDLDGDGLCAGLDNCPAAFNTGQGDLDGDGAGDACDYCPDDSDDDIDGDLICGDIDNCPDDPNFDQQNTDGDNKGGACDPNERYDGEPEPGDCAPLFPGVTEAPDPIGHTLRLDGVATGRLSWLPSLQGHAVNVYRGVWVRSQPFSYELMCAVSEAPGDEAYDHVVPPKGRMVYYFVAARNPCGDSIPGLDPQGSAIVPDQLCPAQALDTDADGLRDLADNCAIEPNPAQSDADFDFVGDACDNCPADFNPTQSDQDQDGTGDACGGGQGGSSLFFVLAPTL